MTGPTCRCDGSQWDKLFEAGEAFHGRRSRKLASCSRPGHTLASITYLIGDAAFVHDTLFMPDSGTARADFPGGSAARLYRSIQEIFAFLMRPGSSPGTTIGQGAARRDGKAQLASRRRRTNISRRNQPAKSLSRCARLVTAAADAAPDPSCFASKHSRRPTSGSGSGRPPLLKFPLNALAGARW